MNLALVGIDYKLASIELRERVSLSQSRITELLTELTKSLDGAVILSTCNRTEIYLASKEYLTDKRLVKILENAGKMESNSLDSCHYIKRGDELITYLFSLACGMHSMILGEDQIITQVGDAMQLSAQQGAGCAVLNTVFRHSVTCAKKAKSLVNIKHMSPSIVSMAVKYAQPYIEGKNVLVIGNGEIGRLAAAEFVKMGFNVTITLRSYKYKQVEIPKGCGTVPYEERENAIAQADIIVSATKSPHFTVTRDMVEKGQGGKKLVLDLALPRDIEPAVRELKDVRLFDVDDIRAEESCYDKESTRQIERIICEQIGKYRDWLNYYNQIKERAAV